jgi:hypothetical protein
MNTPRRGDRSPHLSAGEVSWSINGFIVTLDDNEQAKVAIAKLQACVNVEIIYSEPTVLARWNSCQEDQAGSLRRTDTFRSQFGSPEEKRDLQGAMNNLAFVPRAPRTVHSIDR